MKTIKITLAIVIALISQSLLAQKTTVNTEASSIEWLGKKVGGDHSGNIQIKSGFLELKDGNITGGEFVIDMTSITNTDVKNAALNKKLVGHLESDDFFNVEKYPSASLVLTESSKFINGKATITGKLTIRGKTETISFETIKTGAGFKGTIEVDRSKFNVKYGSKTFFENIGNKAIDDIFTLDIKLVLN